MFYTKNTENSLIEHIEILITRKNLFQVGFYVKHGSPVKSKVDVDEEPLHEEPPAISIISSTVHSSSSVDVRIVARRITTPVYYVWNKIKNNSLPVFARMGGGGIEEVLARHLVFGPVGPGC